MAQQRLRARWLLALLVALTVGGPGGLAGPVSTAAFNFVPAPWIELIDNIFGPLGAILHQVTPGSIDTGEDGRLTVLVVGSDWRERLLGTGERTDAMMILSVDDQKHI